MGFEREETGEESDHDPCLDHVFAYMTSGSASWSNSRASEQAQVHNGHQYNNYYNYYGNPQTNAVDSPEARKAGEDFLRATREGQLRRIEVKLRERPYLTDYADENGVTALHEASFHGHEYVVRILLEHGADVNAQSPKLGTPLCSAASQGRTDIVSLLIEWRANLMLGGTAVGQPLQVACFCGDLSTVRLLLDKGADVNAVNRSSSFRVENSTALMTTATWGQAEIVELLLRRGADPNLQDIHGRTALMIAAGFGWKACVVTLLRFRKQINMQDHEGITAAMYAARWGHLLALQELVDAGASIDVREKNGYTALDYARIGRHSECRRFLESISPKR